MSKIIAKYDDILKETDALDLADQLKIRMAYKSDGIYVKFSRPEEPLSTKTVKSWTQADDILFGRSWQSLIRLRFQPIINKHVPKDTLRYCGVSCNYTDKLSCVQYAKLLVLTQKVYKQSIGAVRNAKRKARIRDMKAELNNQQRSERALKSAIQQEEKKTK